MARVVGVTYDWKNPSDTNKHGEPNPYGLVYRGAIRKLLADGWVLVSPFTSKELAAAVDKDHLFDRILREGFERLDDAKPAVVFHNKGSFYHQLHDELLNNHGEADARRLTDAVRLCVNSSLYEGFSGRTEFFSSSSGPDFDSISRKDKLDAIAQSCDVPTPETFAMNGRELKEERIYELLVECLGLPFVIKKVYSSGGTNVHPISTEDDLKALVESGKIKDHSYVVQECLKGNHVLYSIRVLCFGDKVLGSSLLVNPDSHYVSNSHQGGAIGLDLAVNEQAPRRSTRVLDGLDAEVLRHVKEIGLICGIDLEGRRLPREIERYARRLGAYPSNCRLQGSDFLFRKGKPVGLEVNAHPGPPGTGMYSAITGRKLSKEQEIEVAADLIYRALAA